MRIAIFDHMSAHDTEANRDLLKLHGIVQLQGPPNGTDIWQPCDQLIIRELRREMRRLMTRRNVRNSGLNDNFEFDACGSAAERRKVRIIVTGSIN